ncbi:hypothetical protein AB1Y20_011219 [Prymnesium parvum]|uniref:Uncharacterized protein n=1 Tax=Prymnesium parvum TaxID=97485 RepID=A0AB34IMK2_PRYPA
MVRCPPPLAYRSATPFSTRKAPVDWSPPPATLTTVLYPTQASPETSGFNAGDADHSSVVDAGRDVNWGGEENEVTVDVLRARAHALLVTADCSAFDPLVDAVPNALLERANQAVWSLSSSDLRGWSKQRLVALLIASISGGRLPSWDDAERPGQRIQEFIGRYRQRHMKLGFGAHSPPLSRRGPRCTFGCFHDGSHHACGSYAAGRCWLGRV